MKMSFGISGAVLQHHSCPSEHTWLNQLIDFIDVADFPIEEYEPFALVSELQLHVWNAGIDYRPKFFPQRAFLDLGYCTLSSNIISSMSGCTLRLLAEDCVLQLGLVNESNDSLIPVLNLGLLNISFRLNAEGSGQPRVDLRSSIHDMHLKTCYDSAAALAQLIAYVANDRDLCPPEEPILNEEIKPAEPKANEEQEVSDHTQNHVSKLMADAVMDVQCSPNPRAAKSPGGREEGIEIFYFPDEPKEKRLFWMTRCGAPGAWGNHLPCHLSLVVDSSGGTPCVVLISLGSLVACGSPGTWGNHLPCQLSFPGAAPNGTCTRCTSLEMSGGGIPILPSFSSTSKVGSKRLTCDFLMDFASLEANQRHTSVKYCQIIIIIVSQRKTKEENKQKKNIFKNLANSCGAAFSNTGQSMTYFNRVSTGGFYFEGGLRT